MPEQAEPLRPGPRNSITDVAGIRVGHWTNRRGATGCTAILCGGSTFAAVDVRGGAPATRETDVLAPTNLVRHCDAVVLSGGSAFGLAAADGVARYLAERDVGFETAGGHVPIVPAASIFDLGTGKGRVRPDSDAGYRAASRATSGAVKQGSVGAGTGATVAKLLGAERRLKSGIGSASLVAENGLVVGAVAVTNALGNIVDPADGSLVAGPTAEPGPFASIEQSVLEHGSVMDAFRDNTTLVCLATNAAFTHDQVHRMAMLAHDGMARTIMPVHTMGDGDIAFAVAMGTVEAGRHDALVAGYMTVRTVSDAVLNSVRHATGLAGVASAAEWSGS